jgi:hypothetical protein
MKPNLLNPWRIIRWSAAVLLFTGTLVVSVDQVKSARSESDGLKKKLANAHDISIIYQKRIERLEKYEKESIQRSRDEGNAVIADIDNASKYIGKTEELRVRLAAINAEDKSKDVYEMADQMQRRIALQEELMQHAGNAPQSTAQKK